MFKHEYYFIRAIVNFVFEKRMGNIIFTQVPDLDKL